MRIFGREPAMYVGIIQAAIALAASLNVFGFTSEQVSLITAAAAAVLSLVVAYFTKDVQLSMLTGLAKAAIALALGFGLPLSTDQTSAIMTFVAVAGALILRSQTSPALKPAMRSETPAVTIGERFML